ncbi:MAG: hypothetical protein Q7W30_01875 [Coriobacteriia bacterium]|nr:hypothetical protein [Coriobacteriia bacterium]
MARLDALWSALLDVAAAPGVNQGPALLLAGLVAILLIIALVAFLLVWVVRTERRNRRRARLLEIVRARRVARETARQDVGGVDEHQAEADLEADLAALDAEEAYAPSLLRRLLSVWLPLALVVTATVGTYLVTSDNRSCTALCHSTDPVSTGRRGTFHAAVRCIACHEDPAPAGVAGTISVRVLHVAESLGVVETRPNRPLLIPSRRCLACHRDDVSEPVVDVRLGISMRHAEPLKAGMACDDCHVAVGHYVRRAGVPMERCMGCHDNDAAPSTCATCHLVETGPASRGLRDFGTVRIRTERR